MARLLWIVLAVIGGGVLLLMLNDSTGETLGIGNDAFANALYYGLWGLVLASALLGSGITLGAFARNLAIWLCIVVLLVAGYQYRYEVQDIASRVTAGLVPGSPISINYDDGRQAVSLEKSPGGHFEVRAVVDGVPVRFVIDTGATATVLTTEDAAAVGLDPKSLSYSIPVSTANGIAQAARASVGEISVGGIVRNRLPVLVAADGMLGRSLLGMNFISTLSGFDVRGDRLILRD